mgnify:CR=1 FL=1
METITPRLLAELASIGWLPRDYVEWIEQNGCGRIGDDEYMIYGGVVPLSEIQPGAPANLWTFGDDFSGYNGCFELDGDGIVVEWDSATWAAEPTGQRFPDFIARWRK